MKLSVLLVSFAATAIVVWMFVVTAEIQNSPIMGEPAAPAAHRHVSQNSGSATRPLRLVDAG
jgi:hypothetical protein